MSMDFSREPWVMIESIKAFLADKPGNVVN